MRVYLISLICIFFIVHCTGKQSSSFEVVSQKDDSNNTVLHVVDISFDSILVIKQDGGIIFSRDTGKTWVELGNKYLLDDLTITSDNVLIGIDSWIGIHEESYSRLLISYDFGKSWIIVEFDTKEFFPVKIISNPKKNLLVQTEEGRIYRLSGTDLIKDWVFASNQKFQSYDSEVHDAEYFIDNSNTSNVKLFAKKGKHVDTLARLDSCQQALSLIKEGYNVYISGMGINVSQLPTAYFAYWKNGRLKQNLIPGKYLYLRRSYLGRIYLLGDSGLYIVSNGKLRLLFK